MRFPGHRRHHLRRVAYYHLVMNEELETDYLVVGGGAAAMAFTDALLAHSDATVTIVDRRHAPGGHWIDAYPYVPSPSAVPLSMGVAARCRLGKTPLDVASSGRNAAADYELAGCGSRDPSLLRARDGIAAFCPVDVFGYFPGSAVPGEGRFISRSRAGSRGRCACGGRSSITTISRRHHSRDRGAPPFEVADGVSLVRPAGVDHAQIGERHERFVIIGAGKTALDACGIWLLEQGGPRLGDPGWIKPRE